MHKRCELQHERNMQQDVLNGLVWLLVKML